MTETDDEAVAVELDEYGRTLLDAYRDAKEHAEAWEARRKDLAVELITTLGPASRGTINGFHVVTKIAGGVRERFDAVRLREQMPDLYREFVVPMHVSGSIRLARS